MAMNKVTVRIDFEKGGSAEKSFFISNKEVEMIQSRGSVVEFIEEAVTGAIYTINTETNS